jgi:hypothetical protein
VDFALVDGQVVLRKRLSPDALQRWQGYLHGNLPGGSVDELMDPWRGERMPQESAQDEDAAGLVE